MNNTIKNTTAIILCLAIPLLATAQKTFLEGTIEYTATLQAVSSDGANMGTHSGKYIITIKGKQVKKEFRLDNNFDNTILINGDGNTAYSLKSTQGKKYAIQLDLQELMAHDNAYAGFRIEDAGSSPAIAGLPVRKATIHYNDGSSVPILYTKDWKAEDEHLFEHFPSINGLPLDFTYKTGNGALIHFRAEKVAPGVVENGAFRLPKDYKIISTAEYQELSKK